MSKRASVKDKGSPLDDILGTSQETDVNKATSTQDDKTTSLQDDSEEALERTTYYLYPEQKIQIDELVLNLKKQKVKTNKSELVRVAIDELLAKEAKRVVNILTKHQRRK